MARKLTGEYETWSLNTKKTKYLCVGEKTVNPELDM